MDHPCSVTPPDTGTLSHLGDVDVETFMRNDWHCNARVFRQAIEGFTPLCSVDELLELAVNPQAEVRLIEKTGENWTLTHGPLNALPKRDTPGWTVLIQGLNGMMDSAAALLDRFRFITDARLDDLMVSVATDGGGVGPHFDSYDVFLLQMHGQRKWRISAQEDLSLREGLPLKILSDFQVEEEFILNPGDMLYLPPRYAHDGIAVGECTTLSIGFRSPTAAELLYSVLHQMADDVLRDPALTSQRFSDPRRGSTRTPAALPGDMTDWVTELLGKHQASQQSIARGLLIERTEPKPTVVFEAPARQMQARTVHRMMRTQGVRLHRASRMMYCETCFAVNGEGFDLFDNLHSNCLMRTLADTRQLSYSDFGTTPISDPFVQWCIGMMDAGWIEALPPVST